VDFSEIPDSLGIPYTYWGLGGIDPALYAKAEAAGTVSSDIPKPTGIRRAPDDHGVLTGRFRTAG
jgi:hypothetical protein